MSPSRWMKLVKRGAALATTAVLLGGPAHAAATVEVRYVEPNTYTDIGHSSWDRERALKALSAHLQKLGQALPDGRYLLLPGAEAMAGGLAFSAFGYRALLVPALLVLCVAAGHVIYRQRRGPRAE